PATRGAPTRARYEKRRDDRRGGGATLRRRGTRGARPRREAVPAACDASGVSPPASSRHIDPAAVRRALRAADLRARHGLSQNFLADADVLDGILEAAAPAAADPVLEIGPGLGILTRGLLDAGVEVTAVELDRGLAAWLRTSFADEIGDARLHLVEGDFLDQEVADLVAPPFLVVANLPYHITSPTLHRLLDLAVRPD